MVRVAGAAAAALAWSGAAERAFAWRGAAKTFFAAARSGEAILRRAWEGWTRERTERELCESEGSTLADRLLRWASSCCAVSTGFRA